MAQTVELTLVVHNHQPVGNFDHVFHEACDRAYLPFLRTLLDFPRVRIGLHTSGSLWEWLEGNRREYGELVDELLARDQVELLGGGMYEPILPVLPRDDAIWQLERMSRFLRERFGVEPVGLWVPERVWEPHMPELIATAGLRYCLLDDTHFEGCAPPERIATDYFMTGQGAAKVALLPISKQLRYTIPFRPAEETIDYLRELMAGCEEPPLAVFGDDGEKFGIWPDTYAWVYERGWLRSFLQALTDNDWLDLRLPREVIATRQPADTVYIPARSYSEMGEWTRVDAAAGAEAPPGHWRNFMSKYPESRALYERVSAVSAEARRQQASDDVLDDIGRAQCNCSYWHGVFGGMYLNYLRQAMTYHLLKAERELAGWPSVGAIPTDSQLRNDLLHVSIDPAHGLALSRLDYYPTLFCWTDVLARRREAYHAKLHEAAESTAHGESASIHDIVRVKEPGLERRLVFDSHPRSSFTTCLSNAVAPEQFLFLTNPDSEQPRLTFSDYDRPARNVTATDGSVSGRIEHGTFSLRKSITLSGDALMLTVELAEGVVPTDAGRFWVEFNLTVLTDQAEDRYMEVDSQRLSLSDGAQRDLIREVALVDEWQQRRLNLRSERRVSLLSYPVYTVSSSESGFERTYQGTCIMLGVEPGDLDSLQIELRIKEL